MELKFNGNIYSEGKINGQVISFIDPVTELKINNNSRKNLELFFYPKEKRPTGLTFHTYYRKHYYIHFPHNKYTLVYMYDELYDD